MSYTGAVTPGGPAATRQLEALTITKVSVGGKFDNNAYLLRCNETGTQLLIDAANDAGTLIDLVGGSLDAVFTTHRHPDHWQALAEVVKATSARTYAGRLDAEGIPVTTDVLVDDQETIHFGQIELEAIHLVGHTPGSIALLYQDPAGHAHLFTGDCLFPGGPGRTTNPADFASLMGGLEEKVFGRLPDETVVYPGHGADTTLGKERSSIPEWRARGW